MGFYELRYRHKGKPLYSYIITRFASIPTYKNNKKAKESNKNRFTENQQVTK